MVTGRRSDRWGHEVVAIVQLRPGAQLDEASLLAAVADQIARYKLPKSVIVVDEITRSPAGKPDYRWARQLAEHADRRDQPGACGTGRASYSRRGGPPVTSSSSSSIASLGADVPTTGRPERRANPVATFQVVDETFKIELATPELVDHARRLLAGEEISAIPLGTVVRDDPGVNAPWSWHIDPATLEFADMTIEVCDGLPSFVEDETVTSDQYCPWSATVIAVDG